MKVFDRPATSLVPFSPQVTLSATYTAVLITAAVTLYFWPRQDLAAYITANDLPMAFWAIFSVTLIIQSYLSLRWGRGELIRKDEDFQEKEDPSAADTGIDFIPGGLAACTAHTALLLAPFGPVLVLGAALSGMPLQAFAQAFAILVTTGLLFRILGVTLFLGQGKRKILGYLVSRCALLTVVFGTLVFAPTINPIQILYGLQFDLHRTDGLVRHSGYLYAAGVVPAILSLALINQRLAGGRHKQEAKR